MRAYGPRSCRYKAILLWSRDPQDGRFVAYAFDNGQGHRSFTSEGWKEDKLVLSNDQEYPGRGRFFQHFIYERISDDQLKMTYETSADGKQWRMIDYLVFRKKK
jgi:hypothetical protein